jgi:uncharacterized membrane protein
MNDYLQIIRTIHVVSGSLWIGEIAVINFILIPAIAKQSGDIRTKFIQSIFPKIFKMASILAIFVVITGLLLVYVYTNGKLSNLTEGQWGLSILIGGGLGIVLSVFHFFIEHKLAKKLGYDEHRDDNALAEFHLKLKIVPRIGMIVITVIFLLMINAARGIF